MKRLENKAHTFGTNAGAPVFIEFAKIMTIENDMSFSRQIQTCQQGEQCRLACAGRPHNRHRFTTGDRKTYRGKNGQRALGTANLFANPTGLENCRAIE